MRSVDLCQEKDMRIQTGSGGKVHSEAMVPCSSEAQRIGFQETQAGGWKGTGRWALLFALPWQAAEVRFKRISVHLGVCLLFLTKPLRQATRQHRIHTLAFREGGEGRQLSRLGGQRDLCAALRREGAKMT